KNAEKTMKYSTQLLEETINKGYSFEIDEAIIDGWNIFKKYAWAFLVYWLIVLVIIGVMFFIPLVGRLAVNIMLPVFLAGNYVVCHKMIREQRYQFNDFFGGFKIGTGIWFVGLVKGVIFWIILMLSFVPIIVSLNLNGLEAVDFGAKLWLSLVGGGLLMSYLWISWMYAVPIMTLFQVNFWQALEFSRRLTAKRFGLILVFYLAILVLGALVFAISYLLASLNLATLLVIVNFISALFLVPIYYTTIFSSFSKMVDLDGDMELDIMDHLIIDKF
ncbi:MAG: hypothetical protein AAF598_20805, partial [Bacteroidota bacterium]